MATVLKVGEPCAEKTSRIHLLPCNIEYDGKAKVGGYFDITVRKKEQSLNEGVKQEDLTAVFHGRRLRGCNVQMPSGYTGFVLKEEKQPATDEEDRSCKVSAKFSEFTFWNLETPPSANDNFRRLYSGYILHLLFMAKMKEILRLKQRSNEVSLQTNSMGFPEYSGYHNHKVCIQNCYLEVCKDETIT